MTRIKAYAHIGAYDLYHGLPNLKDAKIIDVNYGLDRTECSTILTIQDKEGNMHEITICKAP